MPVNNPLTTVIQLKLSPAWEELTPQGSESLLKDFFSFLAGYKRVDVCAYNSQPWHPGIAYFLVCNFNSLNDYQKFWERLNKQSILETYAKVIDIALGVDRKVDNEVKPGGHDYCSLVKLSLTDKWFSLAIQEKQSLMGELINVIDNWGQKIDVRWLDADAWTDEYTDYLLIQFTCLREYNEFWQEVRNHPYFASAYFRFRGTIMGARSHLEITTLSI